MFTIVPGLPCGLSRHSREAQPEAWALPCEAKGEEWVIPPEFLLSNFKP